MSDWVSLCAILSTTAEPSLIYSQGGDWGDAEFINGGLDLSMPGAGFGGIFGPFWGPALIPYIENGTVTEARVDDAVRIARLVKGLFTDTCLHRRFVSSRPGYTPGRSLLLLRRSHGMQTHSTTTRPTPTGMMSGSIRQWG